MDKNDLLRGLPKIDELIALIEKNFTSAPNFLIKKAVQQAVAGERKRILTGKTVDPKSIDDWCSVVNLELKNKLSHNLRRMINGTGVVIHTNLGRSLLSKEAGEALTNAATYYSNLEFNLDTGKRGSRYSLVEEIICDLTGAEAAIVVNNNAAAVFLTLETLCKKTEVIVSRGQLVEIGGSFRIPDVMERSGANLVEVGATNRTHLYDYENAITEQTSTLMRVHTSNFRIIGFTSQVSADELVGLARDNGLITIEDLGSGSLLDLSRFGFPKEPTVQELVKAGVDVITFSGDKLLGGPQAGVIVGNKDVIDKIKKNPLNRALRIDKFTLASLEIILRAYYDEDKALEQIPTLRMLTTDILVLKERAKTIAGQLENYLLDTCEILTLETFSRVGGGAYPEFDLESWAVSISPHNLRISKMEEGLRRLDPAIIGRVENDKFIIDARTIQDEEIGILCSQIGSFVQSKS
ncbi:MAG: L-seryl-tRNA(Sec) selenium transferase [Desulfotalea sp.]